MQISAGSVKVTYGQATVVKNGTQSWVTVKAGDLFAVQGDGVMYRVSSFVPGVGQPDSIILTAPYRGTTNAAATYVICTDFTPYLLLPLINRGDVETSTIFDVAMAMIDTQGSGVGDMLKSVYDTANRGYVDRAVVTDTVGATAIDNVTIKLNAQSQIYSTGGTGGGGGGPSGGPVCVLQTSVAISTSPMTFQVDSTTNVYQGAVLYAKAYGYFSVAGIVGNQLSVNWLAYSGDAALNTVIQAPCALYQQAPLLKATGPASDGIARTGYLGSLSGNTNDYVGGDGLCHNITNGLLPVGCVIWYVSSTNYPGGWMVCNGAAISRATYPDLYAVIGTTYGAGDGSTTFNLPDLRGRVGVGAGQGTYTGAINRVMAASGGEELHVLVTAELAAHAHSISDPTHNHSQNAHNHGDPGHNHAFPATINVSSVSVGSGVQGPWPFLFTSGAGSPWMGNTNAAGTGIQNATATNNAVATGITGTASVGSGTGHNNMQPFLVGTYLIKVAPGATIAPTAALADTTQNGLLRQVSGNITDYVGGDNFCHPLTPGNAITSVTVQATVPALGTPFTVTVFSAANIGKGDGLFFRNQNTVGGQGVYAYVTSVAGNVLTLSRDGVPAYDGGAGWTIYVGALVFPAGIVTASAPGVAGLGPATDIQVFTSTGANTWTKPTSGNPRMTEIICIGGGGGGSSGEYRAAGTACGGGGGGGGGYLSVAKIPSSQLGATATANVGAGGAGGPAVTTAGLGAVGTQGGASWFGGSATTALCTASGGQPGAGNTAGAGGAGGANNNSAIPGYGGAGADGAAGGSGAAGVAGIYGSNMRTGAGGGGGGGGLAATQVALVGGKGAPTSAGAGGGTAGAAAGVGGGGSGAPGGAYLPGDGAGGGGSAITAVSRANQGGVGGLYGGGGGGGGAGQSTVSTGSGAGGAGAAGVVVVITYF